MNTVSYTALITYYISAFTVHSCLHDCSPSTTEPDTEEETTTTSISWSNPCFCSTEWWDSANYHQQTSCACNGGIKQIMLQYTGSSTLSSLTFHQSASRAYPDCLFANLSPGDIVQCTSYPFSQFDDNLILKAIDSQNADNNCESSIHASCSNSLLLDSSPSQCGEFKIVGWVDHENYICNAESEGNRRRQLSDRTARRLLSSSSSSSSGGRPFRKPTPKPTPRPTRKPTARPTTQSTTASPTAPGATLRTTEQTQMDATTSTEYEGEEEEEEETSTTVPIPIDASLLFAEHCVCDHDSADSWDDTHDIVDGKVVTFDRDPYEQQSQIANGAQPAYIDHKVKAANNLISNDGRRLEVDIVAIIYCIIICLCLC
eukprot:CAMPEP_0197033600 /NCGR_PEP_ID=MMETSP1384-20130603/11970_1 /TAXON_ID=29189 /ORGANISM="Ammonia sp." /LENGTH=372 /DNA_ID=CAMNT_0042463437 /DNA_START=33 /DNA_END=1151 /DNA_ORIENTATION=+